MKKTKFPWPYHINEETKIVSVYVVSGWPSVMMIPKKVEEYFPGYKGKVVSKDYFEKLKNETNPRDASSTTSSYH